MISNLFKVPRHRSYNYQPRYFDPAKEEREKRLKEKEAQSDMDREEKELKMEKRISIKSNYIAHKYAASKEDKIRRYIRIVTIALLLLVLYMLFDVVVEMY